MIEKLFCNICNDDYHNRILKNQAESIRVDKIFDNCPECGSRPRIKTFRIIYDSLVLPIIEKKKAPRNALIISGVRYTINRVTNDFNMVVSGALYGKYGDNTIKTDLRDLKEFNNEDFDYVGATLVLDYIEEHEDVFKAVYRVLKKKGLFLFHIAEARLLEDDTPTFIKNYKKKIIFKEQYPSDYKMPSIKVGKRYIIDRLMAHNFLVTKRTLIDIFSGVQCTWFLAEKV